jgi:hypothetical protein
VKFWLTVPVAVKPDPTLTVGIGCVHELELDVLLLELDVLLELDELLELPIHPVIVIGNE